MKSHRWRVGVAILALVIVITSFANVYFMSDQAYACTESDSYELSTDVSTITESKVSCVNGAKGATVQQNITITYNRLDGKWEYMNSSKQSGDYAVGCSIIKFSSEPASSTISATKYVGESAGDSKTSNSCTYGSGGSSPTTISVKTSITSTDFKETYTMEECTASGGSLTNNEGLSSTSITNCSFKIDSDQEAKCTSKKGTVLAILGQKYCLLTLSNPTTTEDLVAARQKVCTDKGLVYDAGAADADEDGCTAGSGSGDDSCTANAGPFGWLMCPGVTGITAAIDWVIGLISDGFKWDYLADSTSSVTVKDVWSSFLNIANIAFAIVFLLLIYSTATSAGLSNYSVKKIMPRLIIVAVGVNLSFYICAALADLSNIAGAGAYSLLTSFMTGARDDLATSVAAELLGDTAQIVFIIIVVLLAGFTVLVGLITILVAVALRSVALTMLVILSPLAFVAALLPNTEKWWKKWRDEFIRLLVVYPAFMVAWGGSRLVANISFQTEGWGWLIALLASVAPLAIILPLFKATGGLMGKMTGLAEKGVNAMGGNALKGLDKERRQFAAERAKGALRGVATRGLGDKKEAMDKAANDLSELQKAKADRTFSQAEQEELAAISRKGLSATSEEKARAAALTKKRRDVATGAIKKWTASDEDDLSQAQRKTNETARAYNRQANGLRHRLAFNGSDRRAAIANMKSENQLADQQHLGRRLGEDDRFRRRYSGVTRLMDDSTRDAREGRAFGQSQVIGDKETQEALDRASAVIGNAIKEDGVAVQNADMISALTSGKKISVTVNGRQVELDPEDKAVRMQMASIVAKLGSAGEVGQLLDVARDTDDALVRKYIVDQVAQSPKSPAEMAGANVPNFAAGKITRAEGAAAMLKRGDFRTEVLTNKQAGELQTTIDVVTGAAEAMLNGETEHEGQDINTMLTNFESTVQAVLESSQSSVITGNPVKLEQIRAYAQISGKTFKFGGHTIDGTGYHP